MAACEAWLERIVDEAGGAPDPELRAHLASCAGCRDEAALMASTIGLLARTRQEPDDFTLAGFAARTTQRAETFRDRSVRGLFWSMTRGVRFGLGLSTAALAASVALFVVARPVPHQPEHVAVPTVAHHDETSLARATPTVATTDPVDNEFRNLGSPDDTAADAVSLDSGLDGLSGADLAAFDQLLDEDPT